MRSHGVANFPDPGGNGGIPKEGVIRAKAVSNSQVEAAQNDCRLLLPAGGSLSGQASQPVTAQDQQDYLKAAGCMRSHGISNFPDPTFSNGTVRFNEPSGIDTQSTQFTRAQRPAESSSPRGSPIAGQQDDTVDGSRHQRQSRTTGSPPACTWAARGGDGSAHAVGQEGSVPPTCHHCPGYPVPQAPCLASPLNYGC